MKLWSWIAAAIVATALVAVACGDDNGSDGANGPTAAATEAGGQPTEPPEDGDAGSFEALAGTYEGAWFNETFQTTAAVTIELAIDGDTATFTLTLADGPDGAPFGVPAPDPKVLEGTIEGDQLTLELIGDDLFGDMSVLISAGGGLIVDATMDGVEGVTGMTVDGIFDEELIDLRYTVTLSDGTEAAGAATLERS